MALNKADLTRQVNRYMTLVSNLETPDADYLNHLDYFKGLIQASNSEEMSELIQTWDYIKPKDARSLEYIETGKLND